MQKIALKICKIPILSVTLRRKIFANPITGIRL